MQLLARRKIKMRNLLQEIGGDGTTTNNYSITNSGVIEINLTKGMGTKTVLNPLEMVVAMV